MRNALAVVLGSVAAIAALGAVALVSFSALTVRRIERSFPPRGRFLEIDGTRVHYIDEGKGPTLVLVHGLNGQMGNFTHSLVERLRGDFRVIAFDRPGSGHSLRPAGMAANVRAQAAFLAHFIAALQLDRPVVVGHSLGGGIALALALDFPEDAKALVLIAPLTHRCDHVPAAFSTLSIASPLGRWMFAWTLAIPAAIRRRALVLATLFGPDPVPSDFATKGGGFLSLLPRNFNGAATDLAAANVDIEQMMARYASIAIPVAVLFGKDDAILDHRVHGEALSEKLPAARLALIEGGHMLPVSAPDQCATWIRSVAMNLADIRAADHA